MHALRRRNTALNRAMKKVLTISAAAGLGCARFVIRKHTFTGFDPPRGQQQRATSSHRAAGGDRKK